MRLFSALTLALLLAWTSMAQGQEAGADRVRKLLEVTGTHAQVKITIDALRSPILAQIKPALRNLATQQGMAIPVNFDQIAEEEYDKAFSAAAEEMINEFIPLYQKAYSADDLEKVIAFYDSALGRRLVATNNEVSKVTTAMGSVIGAKYGRILAGGIISRMQKAAGATQN